MNLLNRQQLAAVNMPKSVFGVARRREDDDLI